MERDPDWNSPACALSHSPGWKVTGSPVESCRVQEVGLGTGAAAQRGRGRGSLPGRRGLLWVWLTNIPAQGGVTGTTWCILGDKRTRVG